MFDVCAGVMDEVWFFLQIFCYAIHMFFHVCVCERGMELFECVSARPNMHFCKQLDNVLCLYCIIMY